MTVDVERLDLVPLEEARAVGVLTALPRATVCAHDPPWSGLAPLVPPPARLVPAGSVDLDHLEALAAAPDDEGQVVVGLGGGTALDTAKFLAWRTGRPLVQVPTITSVDAAFTDAVGVRVGGRVRYVGQVLPERVVLDVDLVRGAPATLNRAGAGDVLSCHTALHDWRLAAARGHGPAWDDGLAGLARSLLADLADAAPDVRAVTPTGVRFLAQAYRRIGAACTAAGHSRFEEGSEHFLAYAIESATGRRFVHGELVCLGVAVMAVLQGDPGPALDVIRGCGVRCHPVALGVTTEELTAALAGLRAYAAGEGLGWSVADERDVDGSALAAVREVTAGLPGG